ncbi:MAG: SDR family oxidoreductase [Wolbachia endosymbiont of Fragariocoptes setiger]|nr:SDR family oxidoreductase [Wolbachia endosymbiont of Fragariocoptes setiger]
MNLFCFGYGYVAQFLRKKLSGHKISGTSCNLHTDNVQIFDYNQVDESILKAATHVLISIPPNGDNILEKYGHHLQNIQWLGYLSATSVYGDYKGNWVNENSQTRPSQNRGKDRLKIEKKWLASKLPVHIFRLAGIYGPGRNLLVDLKIGKAKNVEKKNHYFSRIHVEDIANILLSSMQNINSGEIYNCADDLPSSHFEVLKYATQLLNIELPTQVDISSLSSFSQSFYAESRKVSNRKIKQDLSITLVYPNYRIGLNALFKEGIF